MNMDSSDDSAGPDTNIPFGFYVIYNTLKFQ